MGQLPQRRVQPSPAGRYDVETRCNGVAHPFVFQAPLENERLVDDKPEYVATTRAKGVRRLVEENLPDARHITLVMDNLNTLVGASLYKPFSPEKAKWLLEKLEFVYTPKYGSWLNKVECGFNAPVCQCLDRRLPDIGIAGREVDVRTRCHNEHGKPVE